MFPLCSHRLTNNLPCIGIQQQPFPPCQIHKRTLSSSPVRVALSSRDGVSLNADSMMQNNDPMIFVTQSSVSAPPTVEFGRNLMLRPSPGLGLLSIVFVLTAAVGAIFPLAIISIPAMNAFKKLAASMTSLSKVVSEEVPGTLSSLKLSGLEINDLTQQLSNLRPRVSGSYPGKKDRRNKATSKGGRDNPLLN